MTIQGVLFDKDGTLIEANGTWVPFYKAMLEKELKLDAATVEAKMVMAGYDPETDGFLAGSMLAGGTTRQLVGLWWPDETVESHDMIARRLDLEFAPLALQNMKPLLPLPPIFDALRAMSMALGVATNDSERSARAHMNALGVLHYFADVIGADSVAIPKPSGQMVQRFAAQTGLAPAQIAMVGDNTHDLEEAKHGGAGLAIGVLSGNAEHNDLAPFADYVIESVAQLPALLRTL
jgi:phosphoglycolate phosphatase